MIESDYFKCQKPVRDNPGVDWTRVPPLNSLHPFLLEKYL